MIPGLDDLAYRKEVLLSEGKGNRSQPIPIESIFYHQEVSMKESDVKGLVEIRQDLEARLKTAKDRPKLLREFQGKAVELVRDAVTAAKISEIQTLTGTTPFAQNASGTMQASGDCGFCEFCITDCQTCVAYA